MREQASENNIDQTESRRKSTFSAIVSNKQLGDVTLLEPLTRLMAERTGQPVALFVKDVFKPLIALMPHAVWGPDADVHFDEVLCTDWGSKSAVRVRRCLARLKRLLCNRPDHIRWWYHLIYREVICKAHEPFEAEYWGLYFWRVLGGDTTQFVSSRLNLPPAQWRHPQVPTQPFMVIVPTSAWPEKLWSDVQWSSVIKTLGGRFGKSLRILMLGGMQEFEKSHCADIEASSDYRVVNLCGQTNLKQYLHALSRAEVVLSVDGSGSHLAQAFDRPTVTLFGITEDRLWHYATPKNICLASRQFTEDGTMATTDIIPARAVLEAFDRVYSIRATTFQRMA